VVKGKIIEIFLFTEIWGKRVDGSFESYRFPEKLKITAKTIKQALIG
jgi:hypothetical protein